VDNLTWTDRIPWGVGLDGLVVAMGLCYSRIGTLSSLGFQLKPNKQVMHRRKIDGTSNDAMMNGYRRCYRFDRGGDLQCCCDTRTG